MWIISVELDDEAETNLISKANIIAAIINKEHLSTLKGNDSDLALQEYSSIKHQLYNVRTSIQEYKFVYILGYNAKLDSVFFFVDSQLTSSEDYAPPGLIYDEISDDFKAAVLSGEPSFVGPVTDRWGTIVTALIPMKNPETGKIIATLGMDVEADNWLSYLLHRSLLPISLIFLTTVLFIFAVILKMKTNDLSQTVKIDSLTGLFSRKTIIEQATIELNRSKHSGNPFSIIVLDIDDFKKINDLHGHQSGDNVLRLIALCFKHAIRKTDMAGRVGGEEFIILLPDTDEADAIIIAEKIRNAIELLTFDSELHPELAILSASLGVSTAIKECTDFELLFERADKALYQSKRSGKNMVSSYTE